MENKKIISMLQIAKKAGKISYGIEAVRKSTFRKNAKLIVIASDIAERTLKDVKGFSNKIPIEDISLSKVKLGEFLGRKELAVLSVTDVNFANGIKRLFK